MICCLFSLSLFNLKKYKESIEAYQEALLLDPSNPNIEESLKLSKEKYAMESSHMEDNSLSFEDEQNNPNGGSNHGTDNANHHPSGGGLPDFSQFLKDPQLMNMAKN